MHGLHAPGLEHQGFPHGDHLEGGGAEAREVLVGCGSSTLVRGLQRLPRIPVVLPLLVAGFAAARSLRALTKQIACALPHSSVQECAARALRAHMRTRDPLQMTGGERRGNCWSRTSLDDAR